MNPKTVNVRVTHGRSVPFSWQGKPVRLRKGEPAHPMPYAVYLRYKHKLEIVSGAVEEEAAVVQKEEILTAAAAPAAAESPAEWPLKVSPEDYIKQHGEKEDPSPTVANRLELARRLVE